MPQVGNIEVYTNENCNLTVNDITESPSPQMTGYLLFWSDDNWATHSCDMTNPSDHSWDVPAVNGTLYSFVVFHVVTWDDAETTSVPADCIVEDQGVFYLNSSGVAQVMGTDDAPHLNLADWTVIDCTYLDELIVLSGLTDLVQITNYASGIVECPLFTVNQSDVCYKWNVCDVSGLAGDKVVNVYEYGGTEILSTYTLPEAACVEITLPEDGVFVIEIIWQESGENREYHLAYEICTLKTCYLKLVEDILCQTWDPCCAVDVCSEAEKKALQIKRDTLNQITALVVYVTAAIFVEHTKFTNLLSEYHENPDETRDAYIKRVQDAIDRINMIIGRCGQCGAEISSTTSNSGGGCSTCGS